MSIESQTRAQLGSNFTFFYLSFWKLGVPFFGHSNLLFFYFNVGGHSFENTTESKVFSKQLLRYFIVHSYFL
jgi:hypothetical protein